MDVLTADTVYTLEVEVGNPGDSPEYRVELWAGPDRLVVDDNSLTATLTEGTFATSLPYYNWAQLHFLGESDSTIFGAEADPNHDGIENVIAYATATDPKSLSSPLSTSVSGNSLSVVFPRYDRALNLNPSIEYSINLIDWTTAQDGVENVTIAEVNDFYPAVDGDEVDQVTVTIPAPNGETKLFVRLAVDQL